MTYYIFIDAERLNFGYYMTQNRIKLLIIKGCRLLYIDLKCPHKLSRWAWHHNQEPWSDWKAVFLLQGDRQSGRRAVCLCRASSARTIQCTFWAVRPRTECGRTFKCLQQWGSDTQPATPGSLNSHCDNRRGLKMEMWAAWKRPLYCRKVNSSMHF